MSERAEMTLVFLMFCALGIAAMAPSVTFGDAGEFTACAATLSLAHAPSYPLAALLGKALGTVLPLGNWAFRTNLLSALCGAGALALLVRALRLGGLGAAGRWAAVLGLGLCPLWRYESGVTEVFALHGLVLAWILWLIVRFSGRLFAPRPMAALGLAFGFGAANHHTIVLAAPAAAWEVWRSFRSAQGSSRDSVRALAWSLAAFAAGFFLYLFLPLRARALPPFDWGHPVDLPRFLWVLLRKDYGSLSLTVEGAAPFGAAAVWSQLGRWLGAARDGLGPAFLGLAAVGLAVRKDLRPGRTGLLLWIFFSGPFFLILGNPSFDSQTSGALERFYLCSWMGVAVLAAAGVEAVGRLWKPAAWLLLLVPLAASLPARGRWWLREDFAAYDYGRSVLKSVPPGAALVMDGGDDTFYTTAFLSFAQRLRADVDLHDRGGVVFRGAYGEDFRRLSASEKEARRVRVERLLAAQGRLFYSTVKDRVLPDMPLQAWGLLRRPLPAGALREPAGLWETYPFRWQEEILSGHYRDRALVCFYPVMRAAALQEQGLLEPALLELRRAWGMAPDALWLAGTLSFAARWIGFSAAQKGAWDLAGRAYLLALAAEPGRAESWDGLGTAHERAGRPQEAERAYREAARLEPGSGKAYYNLGALYWGRSRWAEAAQAFSEAARLEPGNAAAAAYALQARRRADKAR
ncbi:MAG: DUF2723 domain-containing protein [Elusimicrobia bacterium]|nr:DUF2723 domain-containing protein [Elusimicrobiota bacterium]